MSQAYPVRSLLVIFIAVGAIATAFAYTAGWLTPNRITPDKMVASLAPPVGPALGHRRNHTKGICFIGTFSADGSGSALSTASVFSSGVYPVVGRLNVGSPDLYIRDASARVRGMGIQIIGREGSFWRMALIDLPFFPVASPQAFFELQVASASKQPDAMQQFVELHPEFNAFRAWASTAPWTASYAEEQYNSIDSFVFVNSRGIKSIVRWSLVPAATPVAIPHAELAQRDPDFLESEIVDRAKTGPVTWNMLVTIADAGDPTTDPSKAWPRDRRTVTVGKLKLLEVELEHDGPCRSINFDPTILPSGISTSEDPFLAARSSAYRRSYDLRTSEARYYPESVYGGSR